MVLDGLREVEVARLEKKTCTLSRLYCLHNAVASLRLDLDAVEARLEAVMDAMREEL